MITENTIARTLTQLLTLAEEDPRIREALEAEGAELVEALRRVRSFEEAGLMTRDDGIVLYLEDGSEFQVTVVQRR